MNKVLNIDKLCVESAQEETSTPLLNDVTLELAQGETLALIGESGSGKSLTALSIMRLLPEGLRITSGDIRFQGKSLFRIPESSMQHIRGSGIGFVFQEPMTSLNPVMSAGKQILECIHEHTTTRGSPARKIALDLLNDVGIPDPQRVYSSYPHELSGGMKQRVVIAMALVGKPQVLIADEPTTALDVTIQAQILALLKALQARHNMAILFISHDLSVAYQIADRIAVMQNGEIVEQAASKDFFVNAQHSYSKKLLAMLPDLSKRGKSLSDQQTLPTRTISEDTLVTVENLKVYFPIRKGLFKRTVGHIKAVDDVSLTLRRGQTLALVGESGSGKTTIARSLLNLVKPTAGTLRFARRDAGGMRDIGWKDFVRGTQIVFQDPFSSLNPKMPVGQAIGEGLIIRSMSKNKNDIEERVAHLLSTVGLSADCMRRYPHQFSGGQRQRLCIARALAVKPDFIIWDEPTSALDITVQAQILDLFQRIQADYGLGYLLITHDMSIVSYMADEVAVIHKGRFVEQGSVLKVFQQPAATYTQELLAAVPTIPASEFVSESTL